MADSHNPENGDSSKKQHIPSPALPKIPSPAIPDINKSAKKPVQKPEAKPDSFHFEDPELEAKRKTAPAKLTTHTGEPAPTKAPDAAKNTNQPKPFSPAAVPTPRRTAPKLSPHTNTPGQPKTAPNSALHQSLEQRPLSIEEKEELDDSKPATSWRRLFEFLQPISLWLVRLSIMGSMAAVAFLLLNLFRGNLAPTSPLAASEDLMQLLTYASLLLEVSVVVLACCLMLLWFDTTAMALSILAMGLLLHFGVPLLLFSQIGSSQATAIVAMPLRQAGLYLLAIGIIKYAFDVACWIRTLPERMQARADIGVAQKAEAAQRRIAKNATAFSPCWQLPFCREVIRKQCPAYLARKTCWKFGRGCYCDEEMISRIIRGESLNTIKAPTRMSRKGKPPCGRCYIFLEHQAHKFRMLSPLAVPVTVLAVYLLWPTYTGLFKGFSQYLDKFWNLISFNPQNLTSGVLKPDAADYSQMSTLSPEQVSHVALIMIGVLLGFMLLIYLSKFIEWAVYTAKW